VFRGIEDAGEQKGSSQVTGKMGKKGLERTGRLKKKTNYLNCDTRKIVKRLAFEATRLCTKETHRIHSEKDVPMQPSVNLEKTRRTGALYKQKEIHDKN